MSKRSRDDDVMMNEPLGPRSAKRKALNILAEEKAKQDASAEKRQVNKKLRAEVDDLAGLFGSMKASDQGAAPAAMDVEMDMAARGRRRKTRKRSKKSRKGRKKTRKH
jgi:hypothetical protein